MGPATIASIDHIRLDQRGIAYVGETRSKVRFVVIDSVVRGMSPQDIVDAYPHLNLAQVHAALAYYYDHKAEVDREIAEAEAAADEIERKARPSGLADRLKSTNP